MKPLLILLLSFCIACSNTGVKGTANTAKPKIAALQNSIDFEIENKDGFILPDTLEEFNKDLTFKASQIISKLEKVHILKATKKKYHMPHDSDECKEANFLEIEYDNKQLVVSGKDVYELDSQKPLFTIKTDTRKDYEMYTATNFAVGVADSIGLTGCEDYSIFILRRVSDGAFSLIQKTDNYFRYSVLRHDDGEYDTITNVLSSSDTIIMNIGVSAQTGSESFKLKVLYDPELCKAIQTNIIYRTGGKEYDENGNEIK